MTRKVHHLFTFSALSSFALVPSDVLNKIALSSLAAILAQTGSQCLGCAHGKNVVMKLKESS